MAFTNSLPIGTVLNNRYLIISYLGSGGMGGIYLAEDTQLKCRVVVKENTKAADRGSYAQFECEAQVLANLKHKNLPTVYSYFVEEGRQFLVMEYIEGYDLKGMVFPLSECLKIVEQIVLSLDYIHNLPQPVIHRDIKPANIMVKHDGTAYLVDFGIMKVGSVETKTGARYGTEGYAPPEQYFGKGDTDHRSDQYSLAATIYTLLTGVIPVNPLTKNGAPGPAVASINPSIPQYVSKAIERGMSFSQGDRFPNILSMWHALNGTSGSELCITLDNARQLKPTHRFGRGSISEAKWAPNGKCIAVRARDGVWVYDGVDLTVRGWLQHDQETSSCDFSPDGAFLVTLNGKKAFIWSMEDYSLVEDFSAGGLSQEIFTHAFFLNESKLLLYCKNNRYIYEVTISTAGKYSNHKSVDLFWFSKPQEIVGSAKGFFGFTRERFVVFGDSTSIEFMNARLKRLKKVNLNGKNVSLSISGNGTTSVALFEKNTIYLLGVSNKNSSKKLVFSDAIVKLGISTDGDSLVIAHPGELLFYDWQSKYSKGRIMGDFSQVSHLAYSPRDEKLLVTFRDHRLQLYEIKPSHPLIVETIPQAQKEQSRISIGFSTDNTYFLAESPDFHLVWRVSDWTHAEKPANKQWVMNKTKAMESLCKSLSIEVTEGQLIIRDLRNDAIIQHKIDENPIAVTISPDRSMVATATSDGRIKIWTIN